VHLSRWITTHGLAFNVNPKMEHFRMIVPCGLAEHAVTSLECELSASALPTPEEVASRLVAHFSSVFEAELF
jgi:lipoyl(octanoyl) transferase